VIEWWEGLTRPFDEARVRQGHFVEAEDWAMTAIVENARAVHVYEKAGFEPLGVLPAFEELDGERRDCLLMQRWG